MRDGPGRDIELGSSRVDIDDWGSAGVILTTFETMRDYHLSFARQPFGVIIYDEAQKLKNPASQMTRAAKTLNARFQIAMTGTPVENRLQDLWSIFDVVHPGLLGSSKAFETDYPADSQAQLKVLHDLLTTNADDRPPVLLRRMKDDCLPGLPSKRVEKFPVEMPPKQAAAYDRIIQRAMVVKGSGQRGRMLEILQHLRGVSLHPFSPEEADGDEAYFDDSARMATLFSLLDRIAKSGEKVLIFCESLAMQALLATEIRRRFTLPHAVIRIHGGVTGDARQAAVDLFQGRPRGFDAMLLSPKAGGVGLTLTAANHVIHLSRWWNPAVEDQATDRAYRIGQTRDVTVYLPQSVHPDPVIRPSSFDLKLDQLMERKRTLSRGLLMPGHDESDTGALFDAVVQTSEGIAPEPEMPEPDPVSAPKPRSTLTPRTIAPRAEPARRWPTRVEFLRNTARDFTIFTAPVDGAEIEVIDIVDPYACKSPIHRSYIVQLAGVIAGSARRVKHVCATTWDADSVEVRDPESTDQQRKDLADKWRARFSTGPTFQHIQKSRRQSRDLHDRSITVRLSDGRKLVWDLGHGIDGVMDQRNACVVNFNAL